MFRNRVYYQIKPLVPWSFRLAIRRCCALRKREQSRDTWPILPGSERQPDGWPGWPKAKQFAFVLTHDVEGKAGLAKCRLLMELDRKWGFRSSFNFIPEGGYAVSESYERISSVAALKWRYTTCATTASSIAAIGCSLKRPFG